MDPKLEEREAPTGGARAIMQLILPDGRLLAGDAAIPEILRRLRGWRWLALLFRLPGVEILAPRLYAWVARHRYEISCMLGRPRG
jgi:predicted DCC family thiol-disulfide oxidoreductase YuxK